MIGTYLSQNSQSYLFFFFLFPVVSQLVRGRAPSTSSFLQTTPTLTLTYLLICPHRIKQYTLGQPSHLTMYPRERGGGGGVPLCNTHHLPIQRNEKEISMIPPSRQRALRPTRYVRTGKLKLKQCTQNLPSLSPSLSLSEKKKGLIRVKIKIHPSPLSLL